MAPFATFSSGGIERIARVALARGDDPSANQLTGVHVHPSAYRAGSYDVVATSGKILSFSILDPMDPTSDTACPDGGVVISPAMLREIARHYRYSCRHGDPMWTSPAGCPTLELSDDGMATLQVLGERTSRACMVGTYPDYSVVLNKYRSANLKMCSAAKAGCVLHPDYLITAARILAMDPSSMLSYLMAIDSDHPVVGIKDDILVLVMPIVGSAFLEPGHSVWVRTKILDVLGSVEASA